MSGTELYEFASSDWVAEARRYLVEAVATSAERLDGIQFSVCEIYTDSPEHLRVAGGDHAAWHFAIDGSAVDVCVGVRADVDHTITASYGDALPIARTVYRDHPEVLEAIRAHEQAAREAGSGPGPVDVPPTLGRFLFRFHDHMARRTR